MVEEKKEGKEKIVNIKEKIKTEKEEGKKKSGKKEIKELLKEEFDPYKIIKYPLSTEKVIRLMESENKLVFVVERRAKKEDVKKAIKMIFKSDIDSVNVLIDRKGRKKAYVKFSKNVNAIDIATNLGLM